jgi:hypothetical protein
MWLDVEEQASIETAIDTALTRFDRVKVRA